MKKGKQMYTVGLGSKGALTTKIIMIALWFLFVAVMYYFLLPAINLKSVGFWMFLIIFCALPALGLSLLYHFMMQSAKIDTVPTIQKTLGIITTILILLYCIGLISGLQIFHAKKYASILKVEETDFMTDLDQATALNKIALMDTQSAIILGNREIGSLSNVISQYNVSDDYSQVDINGSPVKLSALDYAGFFKYTGNRKNGIPGYVSVDPVNQNAHYTELKKGMKYVPSAYFFENLRRHLRLQYPTKILSYPHFEVDEEGNPYYVCSVSDFTIGLFGGETVKGAVICDPITGDSQYYAVKDIPTWVDKVFDGDLLAEQYNWYGKLSSGFFNSIFGKKNCKKATETIRTDGEDEEIMAADYGYVAKDGDIWIYTGVTSVNDDASNIGFILVNQRTSEAHYYAIPGADENSAMAAAQGEVQEKGYVASFPSLINVDGQPTYVMVLKDANSIAKLFAMVNVESYNIVTTDSDIDACFAKYKKRISGDSPEEPDSSNPDSSKEPKEETGAITPMEFTVESIQYIDNNGNTWVYFTGTDKKVYKQKFSDNENLIFIKKGDTIKGTCFDYGTNIYKIKEIEN